VTHVVTRDANPNVKLKATRFVYALNSSLVAYVLGEEWFDVSCQQDQSYTVTYAREFRYDSPRGRYLNRELDPAQLPTLVSLSDTWSDYDGDTIYNDFNFANNTAYNLSSYEPGIAEKQTGVPNSLRYYHTDQIGSTRLLTDNTGSTTATPTYTAFGERLDTNTNRYAYAGRWGYESQNFPQGNEIPYLHVGHRYYDPATGRFLQRDPIGIFGGLNAYAYTNNTPTNTVDPDGLSTYGLEHEGPHGPGTPMFPPPSAFPPPGSKAHGLRPNRKKPLSPKQELNRLKKTYRIRKIVAGCGFAGVSAYLGGAIGTAIAPGVGTLAGYAIGVAIGSVFGTDTVEAVEDVIYLDEPPNPLG